MGVHDIIGTVGVFLILAMYLLLQLGRIHADQPGYGLVNALGAGLILISLAHDFNWSAFLMEACWIAISLTGVVRSWRGSGARRAAHQC